MKSTPAPVLRVAVMFAIIDSLTDNEVKSRGEVVARTLLNMSNFDEDESVANHERMNKISEEMTKELFLSMVKQTGLSHEEVVCVVSKKLTDAGYVLPNAHAVGRYAAARL